MTRHCQIIGVLSLKGGVGKTTTVVNLGAALAREFGQKVLLIDTNYAAPNLGLQVGIIEPPFSIQDVLNEKATLYDAIIRHKHGFDVIAASLTPTSIDPLLLKTKIAPLTTTYDFILLDTAPTLHAFLSLTPADKLLVVSSPDYPTLSCTMRAVKVAKEHNTPILGLILNKTRHKKFELSIQEIEDTTETPILAVIPDDTIMLESVARTTPATLHAPFHDACIEYKHLAASLVGQTYTDSRTKTRIKKLFQRNLPKQAINRELVRQQHKNQLLS